MASLNISGCGEREWRCRDRHYCVHQVAIRLVMISPSTSWTWSSSWSWSTWSGLAMRRRPRLPGREWRGGRALPQWLQRPPVQMQQWTVSRMRIMLMMTIMTILIVMIKMIMVTRLIGFRATGQLVSIYAFEYQNIDIEWGLAILAIGEPNWVQQW